MKIDFYEEFPTDENLKKLKLIDFPTRIFVAAKSLDEFKKLEKRIKKINKKVECAYWPIIRNSYWISPFSNTKDLIDLFKELEACDNHLLIDLEFPLNKKIIFKNLFSWRKNKKIIRRFLEKNKARVTTAQFPSPLISWFIRLVGLDYDVKVEKSLMWYSSIISKSINERIKRYLIRLKNKSDYSVSLGTIAFGVFGDEPILSPEDLERDLMFVKRAGFEKIVIFRLGGLNEKYMDIIKKFID